jgi:uncharacterized pyridoxal phosphate-containing UPF0001 family protein
MPEASERRGVAAQIGRRWEQLMQAIQRCGRDPAVVRVVIVGKGHPVDVLQEAARATGAREFGENYAAELEAKSEAMPGVFWHYLGRLQTNKIAKVKAVASAIQSLSRHKEVEKLAGFPGEVLVELNPLSLPNRPGTDEARAVDLVGYAKERGLNVSGVMAIGVPGDEQATKTVFAAAARCRERLGLRELSIGMSDDFELALRMGSTMIRIGRYLLGERPKG